MRLLADENIPRAVVDALREAGHDVSWITKDDAGAADLGILRRASTEERLLVTFDTDFGTLAVARGAPAPSGIVLFRLGPKPPDALARFVAQALSRRR
jgi:predicted nuclease of predicted toxin-antitoxin system